MSDGWVEIVEGGELPEMEEPVLVMCRVGDDDAHLVAYRKMVLTLDGHFGAWEWAEELSGENPSRGGRFRDERRRGMRRQVLVYDH